MVVKDTDVTRKLADKTATEILEIIKLASFTSDFPDDPAEHIYYIVHTIGSLMGKVCYVLEEYGKIYGIEGLKSKICSDWIISISSESMNSYAEQDKKRCIN
jgi:hypothetical protein